MADIIPIPERSWVCTDVYKKFLRPMYGKRILRLAYLPLTDLVPETFLKMKIMDVEVMLACLQAGAWLGAEDWQPYARYAIAKRIKMRQELLFQTPLHQIKDEFMDLQLNGGTFKAQERLKAFVAQVMRHPRANPYMLAGCRLIMSVCDGVQVNTVIQPFHWIRSVIAASEANPVYGMTLYQAEMQEQKVALCRMLRATLPS